MLNTNRTAAVGVTRIKLRIHCRRAKPTGERKLRMPMTKRASASGEHAKDAKDPDSIDEKAIHETGPVKSATRSTRKPFTKLDL